MKNTPSPIYENKSGRTTLSLVFTILITGGLFLIIPLTQLSSEWISSDPPPDISCFILSPPPKYVPPPVTDEKQDEPDEKIDLTVDFDPISIRNMEFLWNGHNSNGPKTMMGTFASNNFPTEDPVYVIEDLDVPPKALVQPAPTYPPALKRSGIEGKVEVLFIVNLNGTIRNISIVDATHREFATSVRDALRRASFEPGKIDDKPVTTRVRQDFTFSLSR
jgi:TonB family protein